jgi:hypothetical protein
MALGKEDLSLARLAEAHFDAIAILAEAGREPAPGALYGVWASELPGTCLNLIEYTGGRHLSGTKRFCTGGGIVDRALITVGSPEPYLVEIDMRKHPSAIQIDTTEWKTSAFSLTNTATITFGCLAVSGIVHGPDWYLNRPGFWHGACGPAACWAGGAEGLVDYAFKASRTDPHTLAHLGAMHALVWQMRSCLDAAGREIDAFPADTDAACIRALSLRHIIEQSSTEILRRFARVCGPRPLAFDEEISRRYHELDLYLRQCHAERDLESLGQKLLTPSARSPRGTV